MNRMLLLALPLALSGCMVELLTTTAIQGELASQNAQAGMQALDHAKETRARTEAEQAIRAYYAEKGVYPPSLLALVPAYLPRVPVHADGSAFGYDPATGALLEMPPPAAPQVSQADRDALAALDKAVYAYWEATGLYPPSLQALAPTYIQRVPMTSAGEAFVYDPQIGAIYHPRQAPAAGVPVAQNRSGGGGAGALGEATTSIAIQSQLQNMNTSGASHGGSSARRTIGGVNSQYNQQQQRALDEINQ